MKKIVLGLTVIIMCFILTGCLGIGGSGDLGQFTGIYKSGKVELKIVQYKDRALVIMNKENEPLGNTSVIIENNKFQELDCDFELTGNSVKVTTDRKDIPKGEYKRVKDYTIEEIYKEYVGDITYIDDNNGIYENDKTKVYTVRSNEDTVRIAASYKDNNINIYTNKVSDTNYATDLFEDKYELKYSKDKLEIKVDSKDENTKALTGKYTRKSKMNANDIIKIFAFDDYESK